ncbi:MAG: DNA polymerase III subunit gamma/tau [Clostridia bacterium]|nr:DNA polymerase III subunit gamma/tau [Clostridia bacterium]
MYYALYRKYRPLSFHDVLGQDAVTETLRRQVATGQISHAYLFTGTRGTGKTTCAKILARAVNCQNPKDGNPCNECDICKGLLEGTLYDVEEIDAASNNGVENIRQIREEVVYAPTAAKYKVYIIDEVHMLSAGAFNALLKTLEEPPAHAIFILATTEIHKVPATILSRCQRFDFLRLPKKTLIGQFRTVLEKEGKSLDENALDLIAELADGSSRDGLSILDKVIDLKTCEEVEGVLGVIPKKRIFDLLLAAADGDVDTMYRAVEDMYNASADLGRLCTSMMDTMKDVMIFRSAKNPSALLEKSEGDVQALTQIANRFPPERILYSLRILQETVALLPRSLDKRADAEVCMLRLSRPDLQPDAKDLSARLATLEQQLLELKKNGIPVKASSLPETIPGKLTPAPTPISTPEKKPEPPKKAPPVFDDPFANPSVSSAGNYREPEEKITAKPIPPAPRPESVHQTPPPAEETFVDGWQPLTAWKDITHTISRDSHMMGFLLGTASAVYQGHTILILVEDVRDYNEIKSPEYMEKIRQALVENRKEGYTVKVEHCSPDKYIPHATMDYLQKENLFDFGDDEEIPEYED